jgi:hypothetical protein
VLQLFLGSKLKKRGDKIKQEKQEDEGAECASARFISDIQGRNQSVMAQ